MDAQLEGVHPPRGAEEFAADVLDGLSQPQKRLPSKYFYDARGSDLFEQICELPEYYPTRTEIALLRTYATEIADRTGEGVALIEFGSGASSKVHVLLDALKSPRAYVPVDISGDHLRAGARAIEIDYPGLAVLPVHADFTTRFMLPREIRAVPHLGFFPGSTIGNFTREAAQLFLADARHTLGEDGAFLVGVDLKKDARILNAAYNDAAGVTAAFNLNLLARINRELDGDFDLASFVHRSSYDDERGAVEMYLVSGKAQSVEVLGRRYDFRPGETIHTEDSHKYGIDEFIDLAVAAGWRSDRVWCDADRLFSLHLLHA